MQHQKEFENQRINNLALVWAEQESNQNAI